MSAEPGPRRKSKRTTHNKRSLDLMIQMGYIAEMCEKWLPIPNKFITTDQFGCLDMWGVSAEYGILGVNACARERLKDHVELYLATPKVMDFLRVFLMHARFQVWGWYKIQPSKERAVWQPQVYEFKLPEIQL